MKDKKIDIIIPAYKAHKTIEKTLHSIAIQSIIDKVDVTIVNDCCPEGDYQDTIKLFSNFMDIKEIKLDKNCGPGEARNQGMKNTKNDYIMFVDADDYLILPKSLEQMLGIMEDNKQLIVLRSDILEENENCEFGAINGEVDSHVFARLYRRNFIEDNNIWFPPFRANEDVGFNMLFEMKSFYKGESLGVINTPTYFWAYHKDSLVRGNDKQFLIDRSICGMVDSSIYVLEQGGLDNIKEEDEIYFFCYRLLDFYDVLKEIVKSKKQFFIDQAKYYCYKFYHLCYLPKIKRIIPVEDFKAFLNEIQYDGEAEEYTIDQYVKDLNASIYEEEDLKKIQKKIPKKYKQNNIRINLCTKDDYR